jgi:hypothetical protein
MRALFRRLRRLWSGPKPAWPEALVGSWTVTDISEPHPLESYLLRLHADGALEWQAVVPVKQGGFFDVAGEGHWQVTANVMEYSSGEGGGSCQFSVVEDELHLDHLPATKVGPGVRCVLRRTDDSAAGE